MMRQLFAKRLFAQADVVEVRVVVMDPYASSDQGIHGAEVTLDGVTKLTVNGIVSFYNITQGEHEYIVGAPPGYTFVDGEAPFDTPLGKSGITNITWKLVPGAPWPSSTPWLMMFHFTLDGDGNGDGNGDENGEGGITLLGLWNWPYLSEFLKKRFPDRFTH